VKFLETGLVFWWQQVSIFKVVRSPRTSSLNQTIWEAFLLLRLAIQILLHTNIWILFLPQFLEKKQFVFLENARLAEMQINSCSSPLFTLVDDGSLTLCPFLCTFMEELSLKPRVQLVYTAGYGRCSQFYFRSRYWWNLTAPDKIIFTHIDNCT
jgi:hypothetical protein